MRAKHSTLYGTADRVIRRLEESELITRVVLGRSTGKSHGNRDGAIKIQSEVPAGLRVLIYSSKGITEAIVFCAVDDRDAVKKLIGDS